MSPSPLIEVGPTRDSDSSDPPVALKMKVRHLPNCIPPDQTCNLLVKSLSEPRGCCSRKPPLGGEVGGPGTCSRAAPSRCQMDRDLNYTFDNCIVRYQVGLYAAAPIRNSALQTGIQEWSRLVGGRDRKVDPADECRQNTDPPRRPHV
jgi:hypothetical protein